MGQQRKREGIHEFVAVREKCCENEERARQRWVQSQVFSFLLVTVTVARCWFNAGRSCICYCLRMQQWKQHHILMQAYKQRQRPRGFVECTDISYFCTHIVSSLKCFCQTIKIHKIEKSLSWSQYFNHPTISRQWCVASLRIQRSKPGK